MKKCTAPIAQQRLTSFRKDKGNNSGTTAGNSAIRHTREFTTNFDLFDNLYKSYSSLNMMLKLFFGTP